MKPFYRKLIEPVLNETSFKGILNDVYRKRLKIMGYITVWIFTIISPEYFIKGRELFSGVLVNENNIIKRTHEFVHIFVHCLDIEIGLN